MNGRAFIASSLIALVAAFEPATALAGSFGVVPIRLNFGPRDRAVAVTLTNKGDTIIALQAELYAWSQRADGGDQLTLTDDLILAPPIVRLAPQAQQVVRLALLRPLDPQRQLTYRMIVREVPEASNSRPDTVSIPVAIAMSLPVFVTPPIAQRELQCSAEKAAEGVVMARCKNAGNAFLQIRDLSLKRGDQLLGRFEGGAYILPQATRWLRLESKGSLAPGTAQLEATFDDEKQVVLDVEVP